MHKTILRPALIVLPYIAFTGNNARLPDDVEHLARVISSTPDGLRVHVINGGFEMSFSSDGRITESPEARSHGQIRYLQWQGHERHHTGSGDFVADQLDHVRMEIRAGNTGPRHAVELATTAELAGMSLCEAAQRLRHLGDSRLARYLADEYPQIKTF